MHRRPPVPAYDELVSLAAAHGIGHLGVAQAVVFERARTALYERRAAGLAGDMGFTYRNPERSTDPSHSVPGARSVIVAARSYYRDEPARPAGPQARVARYAWDDHYGALRAGLRSIARRLKAAGERAVVFCDDNGLVDREAAYEAGLGWFGKNANLLVPGGGSWFVLGAVVTTAAYEPAHRRAPDGCGSCRGCLDACPTGAIVAPGVIDATRCLSWVLQRPGSIPEHFRIAIADRIYGCDDCQEACPPSVRLAPRHRRLAEAAASAPRSGEDARVGDIGTESATDLGSGRAWVDVLDLLEAADDEVLARADRWYIAGRDPRWLRRNALVVLGNTGDGCDRRTRKVLALYRGGEDEILAEHARWASERLGLGLDTTVPAGVTAAGA